MLKTAAFQLSGVSVDNKDLPILTPLVEGIQYRYRLLPGVSGTLPDSSPAKNNATLYGGIATTDSGLAFTGDDSQYADTGVLTDGSFTIIGVVRPSALGAGVPIGSFDLESGINYRVGTNVWLTSSGENPDLLCAIAVVQPGSPETHRNFGLRISGVSYTVGEWMIFAHQYDEATRTQRLIVGDIETLNSQQHPSGEVFVPSEIATRIGQAPGGYSFNGDIAYAAQWDSMLSLEDVDAQFNAIRSDLGRRGINIS